MQVSVFEIRLNSEPDAAPGARRLRYWVDSTGALRRIEVRTRQGAFGWLDISPARVPALPHPTAS